MKTFISGKIFSTYFESFKNASINQIKKEKISEKINEKEEVGKFYSVMLKYFIPIRKKKKVKN